MSSPGRSRRKRVARDASNIDGPEFIPMPQRASKAVNQSTGHIGKIQDLSSRLGVGTSSMDAAWVDDERSRGR